MKKSIHETIVEFIYDLRDLAGSGENVFDRDLIEKEKQKIEIEEYLDEQLTSTEKKVFEEKMNGEKDLKEEVRLRKKLNHFVEQNKYREELEEAYQQYTKGRKIRKLIIQWSAAAAAIALIAGISLFYFSYDQQGMEGKLFTTYYEKFDRSEYNTLSTGYDEGREKYFNGSYEQAVQVFSNLPNSLNIKEEKYFFFGLTLMELEDYSAALEKFNDIKKDVDHKFLKPAYWYSGLCYLKTNQPDEARETFRIIVENKGYNYRKAEKILKKLQ